MMYQQWEVEKEDKDVGKSKDKNAYLCYVDIPTNTITEPSGSDIKSVDIDKNGEDIKKRGKYYYKISISCCGVK